MFRTTPQQFGWWATIAMIGSAACSDAEAPRARRSRGDSHHVYAMMTQVYTEDDRNVYITLSDDIDLEGDITLDGTREFAGVANIAAIGGKLLVSDGERPLISAFDIDDDLEWHERGQVSFAQYALEDNANLYAQFMVDDHTAYLPFEGTKRIVWDPTDLEIDRVIDDGKLALEQDGLQLTAGGNRNSVIYPESILQGFFYHDEDWITYSDASYIAAYDRETGEQTKQIEVPCPGVANATLDENGNTYFSQWGYSPVGALFGIAPPPCVARIKPDLTIDSAWTTDFRDWTDGRYTHNFRYLGDGKAIANVLHHEELDVDWKGNYDADVEELVGKSGPHWRLWLFDLERERAKEVEGIDVAISSGAQFAMLEGRTFVFLPYDDWGRTKAYEIDEDANATERFDSVGDIFKWIKVR